MRFLLFLSGWLVALSAGLAQTPADRINVVGLVERPLTLTLDSLKQLPAQTGGPANVVSASGEVRRRYGQFRGVLLRDVLNRARIQLPSPKEKGRYYVVAQATDGYTAVFAHNELFNNPTGSQVFVLYEIDGQPIGPDGAFVLFCTDDLITGARHVKWLSRIEVRRVD